MEGQLVDQPRQSESGKIGIVRFANGQEVSLTLGTLILIAIIVACGSGGVRTDLGPTERKLDAMERKLQEIEKKIDGLAKENNKE
jgi:hypothetical protein